MHLFLISMCCGLCASDQLQRGLEKHFYGLLGCFFYTIFFALKGNGISLLSSLPLLHPLEIPPT